MKIIFSIKNELNKKRLLRFLICGVLLFGLAGCSKDKIDNINFENQNDCDNKPKLLLSKEDRNIYTYCLKDTTIKIGNNELKLKQYIDNNEKAIEEIIGNLKYHDGLKDGGTQIYKGDITLVKCNTLDGNKDIYIGDHNMEFKENFCKNDNYTFVRTYTVKEVSKNTEQQYENGIPVSQGNSFKVKLTQFQGDTKTVIINNLWDIALEENKTYEFEFLLYKNAIDIEDDIEYIFNNSNIIEVRETNKIGLDQKQEPINQR